MGLRKWIHFTDELEIVNQPYDAFPCGDKYRCGDTRCGWYVLIKLEEEE